MKTKKNGSVRQDRWNMNYSFRQYTGLRKTPPSMAWLLKQRIRTISAIEQKIALEAKLKGQIATLRVKLDAIDKVIRQHEVRVDPNVVRARRPQKQPLAARGQMNRAILDQLRRSCGEPQSTTQLALGFLAAIERPMTMSLLRDARFRVLRRLGCLAAQGVVKNLNAHPEVPWHHEEGKWVLCQAEE